MTDHLGAAAGERTNGRSGYRNGQYERELRTRVGRLQLEVPRARDGSFSTQLFDRHQRSEKALVLSLMRFIPEEIQRREKPVRIFPNAKSAWRLIGALCSEKHEEWPCRAALPLWWTEFYQWKASHEEETPFRTATDGSLNTPYPPT